MIAGAPKRRNRVLFTKGLGALLGLALTSLVAAGCTPVAPETVVVNTVTTPRVTISANEAVTMINAIRAANGLGPVVVDADLMARAQRQADAMAAAGVMSHTVGGDFSQRMRGRINAPAAENIAAGYDSLQATMDSWVRSSGHYANLLLPSATNIGIAVAFNPASPYRNFYALILAGPPPGAQVTVGVGVELGVGFRFGGRQ